MAYMRDGWKVEVKFENGKWIATATKNHKVLFAESSEKRDINIKITDIIASYEYAVNGYEFANFLGDKKNG